MGRVMALADSAPLQGAYVVVPAIESYAVTNERGEFIIDSIPPGSYTLRVQFIGYIPAELRRLKLHADSATVIQAYLRASSSTVYNNVF